MTFTVGILNDLDSLNPFTGIVAEAYEAMRHTGYLALAVPVELGGAGASLRQISYAQAELARHDGATALASAMHQYLTLMQGYRRRVGAPDAEGVLRRIAGEGAGREEQDDAGTQSRGTETGACRRAHSSILSSTRANGERVTSPFSSWKGMARPLLLASRIMVARLAGTFTIIAE